VEGGPAARAGRLGADRLSQRLPAPRAAHDIVKTEHARRPVLAIDD